MLNVAKIIFHKEMKEVLRDKRSWLTILFVSIFLPLSSLIGMTMSQRMVDPSSDPSYHVTGGEHAPVLMSYLKANGINYSEREEGEAKVELTIPDDFESKLKTGHLPLITIKADYTKQRSAARRLEGAISGYSEEIILGRMISRGISPLVMKPFTVAKQDTGNASFFSTYFAQILVLLILMVPLPALMPAAIDSVAGERERNGLYPLLVQPVPAFAIALGKYFALLIAGLAALIIATIVGFYSYANFGIEFMSSHLRLNVLNGAVFVLLMTPMVMLIAALMMAVASFAKSFKEGQTYVGLSPFLLLGSFGAGFLLDEKWRPFVPFWSETSLASKLLAGGELHLTPWIFTTGAYFIIIYIALKWVTYSQTRRVLAE